MTNNQEIRTGENIGGETQEGEKQVTENQNEATAAEASGSDSTAHDAGAHTQEEPAQTPAASEPTQSAEEARTVPPAGAQLSPNAPRTVKKPADMKPIGTTDQPEAPKPATQSELAKTEVANSLPAEPSGDFDFGAILD